jgi:hypothetical protein
VDFDPNDGRAEAAAIEVGRTIENVNICDDDDDWYVITIPDDAGGFLFETSVSFREGVDIDVYVYDVNGNKLGEATSPDKVVETVSINFVTPGDYYVRVDQFSSDRLVDTTYTLTSDAVNNEDRCTVDGNECASTRPLRMVCDEASGGCIALEGNGEVALGAQCDSGDDCAQMDGDDSFCWPPSFLEGRDDLEQVRWVGSNICTHWCRDDRGCDDVPGTECLALTRRGDGVCLPPRDRDGEMDGPPEVDPSPVDPDDDGEGDNDGGRP